MRLTGLWWWIDRWRKSSAYMDLSLTEQGAYRNLLDEAWLRCGAIPNDENVLAKACGDPRLWRKVKPKVIARFYLAGDGWRNETMDAVIAETQRRSDKQRRYRNGGGNDLGNGSGNEQSFSRDLSDTDPDGFSGSSVTETGKAGSRADVSVQAGQFVDRWRDFHQQYRGVAYLGNPQKDYQAACELVQAFGYQLSEAIAVYGLNDPDPFMRKGTVTLTMLKSRASKYAEELKAKKLA
jgi:uncharacterized protein YdaU (DUF1376 family)